MKSIIKTSSRRTICCVRARACVWRFVVVGTEQYTFYLLIGAMQLPQIITDRRHTANIHTVCVGDSCDPHRSSRAHHVQVGWNFFSSSCGLIWALRHFDTQFQLFFILLLTVSIVSWDHAQVEFKAVKMLLRTSSILCAPFAGLRCFTPMWKCSATSLQVGSSKRSKKLFTSIWRECSHTRKPEEFAFKSSRLDRSLISWDEFFHNFFFFILISLVWVDIFFLYSY